MAGSGAKRSHTGMVYRSPDHLLSLTPDFIRKAIEIRLDGYFGGVYRYVEPLFDGRNLYLEAIHANRRKLESLLAASA